MYKALIILLFFSLAANGQLIVNGSRNYTPFANTYIYPYQPNFIWWDATNSASYSGSGTTWYDLTTNAYYATLAGSPNYNASNPKNFKFNGATTYTYSGANYRIGQSLYSFGVWFNTNVSQIGTLYSYRVGSPTYCQLTLVMAGNSGESTNGGKLVWADVDTLTTYVRSGITTTAYNDSVWHYAVITRGSSVDSIYVDGSYNASTNSTTIPTIANSLGYTYLGTLSDGTSTVSGDSYTGLISDFEIYNYHLTSTQVAANWAAIKGKYGR